jgi:hypothetical protein
VSPKDYFEDIWERCELFAALYGYLENRATGALQPNELLRAEWATRVSALDLYVHELVAQNLVRILRVGGPPALASESCMLAAMP